MRARPAASAGCRSSENSSGGPAQIEPALKLGMDGAEPADG